MYLSIVQEYQASSAQSLSDTPDFQDPYILPCKKEKNRSTSFAIE